MTGTYHIWSITAGLIASYLFSLSAMRLGICRLATHRRFWNVLLLFNFLTSGLIGLLLTLQVNYKFPLPGEDTWMLIHVDTGIAMTVIAFFHLGWHLSFYLSIFKKKKRSMAAFSTARTAPVKEDHHADVSSRVMLPLMALGFTAMITQLVLLRAFLSVFRGNELVIGIILGNWMLLTALGARLGRAASRMKEAGRFFLTNPLRLGLLPLLTLFLLFILKNQIFIPGTLAGLFAIFLASLVLLVPFCFLSGYSFSFFVWYLSEKEGGNLTAPAYAWESAGSLTGGFLFSFVLVFLFNPFTTLALVLLANTLVTAYLAREEKKHTRMLLPVSLGIVISAVVFLLPVDLYSLTFLYPHQHILEHRETPFGSLVVTKAGDQVNMYENHVLVANTLNTVENEEDVHYALIQRPQTARVLLISGGISGTLQEILKYPSVRKIDYMEINPAIIRLGKKYFPIPDNPQINIIIRDARRYLARTSENYDMILVNAPPPVTAQINRYYTVDFFRIVKEHLTPGGVVSLRLPASQNYLGEEETDINGLIYASLKDVFPEVLIVPGEKNYFLASEAPLSLHIAEMIAKKGIENKYVSPYYIQDDLLQMRQEQVMAQLQQPARLNRDRNPVAYFKQITLWLSYYRFNTKILFGILGLLFLVLLLRSGPVSAGIFAGGLAAASAEILLLFIFQIIYGYIYLMTGILVTVFMAGIAAGSLSEKGMQRLRPRRRFLGLELLLAGSIALLPALVWLLKILSSLPMAGEIVLLGYTFCFAFLTGRLFREGSRRQQGDAAQVASSLYSADLAGGALGALAVAAVTLPLTGIAGTTAITTVFLLLAALYFHFTR
jgi:spermidine synthase